MFKLINNYERRMKNFVLKMAQSPLVLENNKINKNNNLLSSKLLTFSNTISKNKNFSIKNYKSDKQRVEEIMQNKAILDKYLDKIEQSKKKQEKIYKITHEPKLVQPSMRFTARSDLERIYDLIKDKDNYYSKKKEIKKQLAKLGFKSHSIEENLDELEFQEEKRKNSTDNNINIINNTEILTDEQIYRKNLHNKIIEDRKNMMNKKKFLMNLERNKKLDEKSMKDLKEDLYKKTNFKAMENLQMFKTSTMDHNIFKKWKNEDEEKQIQNKKYKNNLKTVGSDTPLILKIKKNKTKMSLRKYNPIFRRINSLDELNIDNNDLKSSYNSFFDYMKTNSTNPNKAKKEFNYKKNNNYNQNQIRNYNISENKKILKELNILKQVVNSNPFLYNINYKNYKKDNIDSNYNKSQFELLKKLAFLKRESMDDTFYNNVEPNKNEYDDIKKEENIYIDGKEFKKNDIDKIAGKLLNKFYYNESKVKYKPDNGGLMFTNGLTIREFEAKYGL